MPSKGSPIDDSDLVGLKHFKRLLPLFARLHEVGCQRDRASNRTLRFDAYCTLVMLYLFNPLIDSVPTLQHVSQLPGVKKRLGLGRFSLGSFSEAPAIFEPDRLKEIINELAADARPLAQNPRLSDLKHALTLADGTVLEALPRLTRAICADTHVNKRRDGRDLHAFRLHMQLDLQTFQPVYADRTGARNLGESRESAVLARSLEANRCYVADGGYSNRALLEEIIAKGSSFVMRVREQCAHEVIEEQELTPQDRTAGIISNVLAKLGAGSEQLEHPVRLITLEVTPHLRRSRKGIRPYGGATATSYVGQRVCDRLVIVTNLVDLPADLVALIYRQRYSIELFIRFFKHLLGMRHLLSRRPGGVDIQVQCAVIACLLINLQAGRKPDKRMMETISWYLMGWMSHE